MLLRCLTCSRASCPWKPSRRQPAASAAVAANHPGAHLLIELVHCQVDGILAAQFLIQSCPGQHDCSSKPRGRACGAAVRVLAAGNAGAGLRLWSPGRQCLRVCKAYLGVMQASEAAGRLSLLPQPAGSGRSPSALVLLFSGWNHKAGRMREQFRREKWVAALQ